MPKINPKTKFIKMKNSKISKQKNIYKDLKTIKVNKLKVQNKI